MKQYPSITKDPIYNQTFYWFDKLDGSNIRAEWRKKQGFYKFGTRHRLLDKKEPILGESIDLFMDKYSIELENRFKSYRYDQVTCFFEFFGNGSFAGNHMNEPHNVVLFDLDVYKKGLLPPKEFIDITSGLDIPKLLHVGNYTVPLVHEVKYSLIPDMTFEGIVGKAVVKKNIMMVKIKSNAWLDKLKSFCGDDVKKFNELS